MWSLLGKKISGFSGSFEGTSQYQIIELLGAGGMGSVYKAKLKGVNGFEKIVAIKTLLDKYTNDPKFVARFIEEAKMVANLIHENIVQIYQLNRTKAGYYFVLEFVDGVSLHDFLEFHQKIRAAMPPELAVFVAARIARGLAYAHSRKDPDGNLLNIVHCDVCTHNIMINSEGVPKIMDFGIAKAANRAGIDGISGKLGFMAPEQAVKGAQVDFAADIYSLGVALFAMLSGGQLTRNLQGELPQILEEIRSNHIAWERLPQDLNPALNDILHTMLETDPRNRFNSTAQLARELEYYIYKDGYGPTIVTMAEYMRKIMPGIFGEITTETPAPVVDESGKTLCLPQPPDDDATTVIS